MFYIAFIASLLSGFNQQNTEVTYLTTADKMSLSFKTGGQTLANAATAEDKFVMNGQMYSLPGYSPVGLYVENRQLKRKLHLVNNKAVNFGINPQAVFFVDTNGKAGIVDAKNANAPAYKWATQIAPMLLQDGTTNPNIKNFKGLAINRNGIGITKDGRVLFLFAPQLTTLPGFAELFKKHGCTIAAFVDASVSEYWTPGKNSYGSFGVIIKSK